MTIGCAGTATRLATIELTLRGGADQNPDAIGNAADVAVHVFQLRDADRFKSADIFALIERESATLAGDVLESQEYVIAPGEIRKITQPLAAHARYIGIIVLFRDIDHATWRAMSPVTDGSSAAMVVSTTGNVAALIKA